MLVTPVDARKNSTIQEEWENTKLGLRYPTCAVQTNKTMENVVILYDDSIRSLETFMFLIKRLLSNKSYTHTVRKKQNT